MSYLLYQKDCLVGVFDELQKANDMAQGIIDNGWAKDFHIIKFKINTCVKLSKIEIKNKEETESENSDSVSQNEYIELNNEDEKDIKKEKASIQKKLNLLKLQKDKLDESKTKYDVDLNLYNQFKLKLEEDINFEIPELFQEKYKIFHQLESQDNLNWETFSLLYKEKDFHGNYTNVFELTNDFETKFLSNIDSETEDSEFESDDETSNSENIIEIVEVLNSSDDNSSSD
jgi:hypothetical protein